MVVGFTTRNGSGATREPSAVSCFNHAGSMSEYDTIS